MKGNLPVGYVVQISSKFTEITGIKIEGGDADES